MVPNGGKGLFATADFKTGDLVTRYTGDLTDNNNISKESKYILQLSTKVNVDAARTNTDSGRTINDPRGTGQRSNCTFVYDRVNKRVTIRTTRPVRKGEEFLITYGNPYWNWMRQHHKIQPGRGKKQVQQANGNQLPMIFNNIDVNTPDPTSLKQALAIADEGPLWQISYDNEVQAHIKNGTFDPVPLDVLPDGFDAIGLKFLFKRKRMAKDEIVRKTRMVAQGCQQIDDEVDELSTYAPVLSFKVLRVLLALAAILDWDIRQLDVKTAFLLADIGEEVYCKAPRGWPGTKFGQFLRVVKAIYGLRRAPKAWNDKLKARFSELGFTQCIADECLFMKETTNGWIIVGVFVDDILLFSNPLDSVVLEGVITSLASQWPINDLGAAQRVLGMDLVRDRNNRTLLIKQESYIIKLLKAYGMQDCRSVDTPAISDKKMEQYQTKLEDTMDHETEIEKEENSIGQLSLDKYGKYVGALLYIAITSHPEIQHAVMLLSKKLQSAETSDLLRVKRVMRYLQGVKHLGLFYHKGDSYDNPTLFGYSDSDWAGDVITRRSTSGNVIMIGGCTVSWMAKQQPIVAQSSTEAEYIAANEAGKEIIWLRMLMNELHVKQANPTKLLLDNTTAMLMVNGDGQYNKRKHIAVKYHWIREQVTNKQIDVEWVDTHNQLADLFTKSLETTLFGYLSTMVTGTGNMEHNLLPAAVGANHIYEMEL
jgi:hypothetical protein